MKKYISLLLVSILLMFSLFGCNKEEEIVRTDYNVNEKDSISIGVLVPTTGDNKNVGDDILEGLNFAKETAPSVNIDKRYELKLSVYDVNSNIEASAKKLIDDKVAAVICYAGNEEKTNEVLEGFKTVNTPLLFVDNNSKNIDGVTTAFSMSLTAAYQASVAAKFLKDEGFKKAAVVYEDNDFHKEYAESFKGTFGAATVCSYEKFNAKSIVKDYDCAFVAGNNKFAMDVAKKLKNASASFAVMMPEMFDKTSLSDTLYNGCYFLSKFESDSDNHYVTSFITMYTQMQEVTSAEITSAIAYGYDAYMLVYGALAYFNPMGGDPLSSVKNGSTEQRTETIVTTSQMVEAFGSKQYDGLVDNQMVFDDNGYFKPNYVFVDNVEGGIASMFKKFVY